MFSRSIFWKVASPTSRVISTTAVFSRSRERISGVKWSPAVGAAMEPGKREYTVW